MHVGWINGQRIYGSVIRLDLINGKIWPQHNGTEGDIAQELMAGGIARKDIVQGFPFACGACAYGAYSCLNAYMLTKGLVFCRLAH